MNSSNNDNNNINQENIIRKNLRENKLLNRNVIKLMKFYFVRYSLLLRSHYVFLKKDKIWTQKFGLQSKKNRWVYGML